MSARNCQKCQFALTATSSQASVKCPRCNTWNDPVAGCGSSSGGCSSCSTTSSHSHGSASGCGTDNGSARTQKNYLHGFLQKISGIFRGTRT